MVKQGADAVRDRVIMAEQRGQMTRVDCVQGLLDDWLPMVAKGIGKWCNEMETQRGPKPLSLPYLKACDKYVAALIGLRAILNGIADERQALVPLAMGIGRTVEHEQRCRAWEAAEPDLFYSINNEMDKNKATSTHRARVNINRFNHLLETRQMDVEWTAWTREVHFRVGIAIIDVVVRHTQWFELRDDAEHVFRKGQKKGPKLVIAAKEGLTDWLGKALDHAEVCHPHYKPTIIPPRRWTSSREGGYHTPYIKTPRLVRFKASQENQQNSAADEYDAIDMPLVYNALHTLQETPYVVNTRVLDVMKEAWAKDMQIGKLPALTDRELPPRTVRMEEHRLARAEARTNSRPIPEPDLETAEEIKEWKRNASPVYRYNARRLSKLRAANRTILTAEEFRHYDEFYFPHMLDFRGRIYPIPAGLQPQGDDLARGLLLYAEGLPLTVANGGGGWLAVAVATAWGHDKCSFEDRVQWVSDNEDLWRRTTANPLGEKEWQLADNPWQLLAAAFEWVAYLDAGDGYLSRLPVMVDGTCNGIQHLSAITRDAVAGEHVNLIPGAAPRDIYQFVADMLQAKVERIAAAGGVEGAKAAYWLSLTKGKFSRSMTKRQVMVLPYGGTKDSFFTYTRAWMDVHDPIGPEDPASHWEMRNLALSFLVLHMWDTVNEVVSGGMKVMKWLQACAKAVVGGNQPIFWVTPCGFVVRHFYGVQKSRQVELLLDGERRQLRINELTDELCSKEQLQGISPNYIHSLDASALVECIRLCREAGLEHFTSVHDAYGTHAANMWALHGFLRQAFVNTHEVDVLGHFRGACRSVLTSDLVAGGMDPQDAMEEAELRLPPMMELGELDLQVVLRSDYFFA